MILALCCFFSAAAQDGFDGLLALLQSGKTVSCSYSYNVRGDFPLKGEGNAVLQGKKFRIEENGTLYFCDGESITALDAKAKEALIYAPENSLLYHLEEYRSAVRDLEFDGKSLKCRLYDPEKALDINFSASQISVADAAEADFSFDISTLGSEWIITDLR